MSFEINLRRNIKQVSRRLTDRERRQMPFATSQALNDIAFMGRKRIIDRTFGRAFTVRNRSFAKAAFRVKKSRKKPGPDLATPASVFDRLDREYLALHARGGTKRARDGRNIAIPGKTLKRGAKGVRSGFRPRQALDREDTFRRGQFIFQRQRSNTLRVLYALTPTARIEKRFDFHEDLNQLGRRRFPALYARRLRNAVRTAR